MSCILPAVAFASEGGESGWGWWETTGRWVNLILLFGLIFIFARGVISKYFSDRRNSISTEIEQADAARRSAEAELAEMKEKMARLDQELLEMQPRLKRTPGRKRKRLNPRRQPSLRRSSLRSRARWTA